MSIELVNRDLCNGCGICVTTCPLDVIRLDTVVAERQEHPSCRHACPAGVDIRGYLYLLKNGMMKEASDILRESLPFPAITGRVCPHPCESECARKEVDEAVNINALERFVADYWPGKKAEPALQIYSARVAVVGSGPAGLACAYFLSRKGYPVTVFESMPVLGGMLRWGIPEFRLPKDVLDAQINYLQDLGILFKTGITVGKDITFESIRQEYPAIFYAAGSQKSRKVDVGGIDLEGVSWGLDFLKTVNLNRDIKVKEKVVVIGGGNVAVDVALTALRLGAKRVDMVCLESDGKMPAFQDEITQTVDEGVKIHNCWGPKKILGKSGSVTGIELVRCVSVFDNRGRFSPNYDEKTTKTIEAEMIILAIGQAADLSLIPGEMKTTPNGLIQIDSVSLATSITGIFAGGDIISGPASVVEAIAAGKKASISIDRYLRKQDLLEGRYLSPKRVEKPPREGIEKQIRNQTSLLPVSERVGNFNEVKMEFNEDKANLEVQRCMTCGSRATISYVDDCQLCLYCERDCPQKAIYVSPEKKVLPLLPWG